MTYWPPEVVDAVAAELARRFDNWPVRLAKQGRIEDAQAILDVIAPYVTPR